MMKYLLCTAIGAAAGYYVATKKLESDFRVRLQESEEEAREYYRKKYVEKTREEGESLTLSATTIDAAEALQKYQGVNANLPVQDSVENEINHEGLDAEVKAAEKEVETLESLTDPAVKKTLSGATTYHQVSSPDLTPTPEKVDEDEEEIGKPYVILEEMYIDNTTEYKQFSITYYAGDDILAGQSDQKIDGMARSMALGADVERRLKDNDLNGKGVIYVRSPMLRHEYEVIRSDGKYSVEVEGNPE